jgi:hypothetical protein
MQVRIGLSLREPYGMSECDWKSDSGEGFARMRAFRFTMPFLRFFKMLVEFPLFEECSVEEL